MHPTRQLHSCRSHGRSWGCPKNCGSCSHAANKRPNCTYLSHTSDMADVSPSSNNRAYPLHHNKHVHHSVKELHLWNLHCLLNCLDDRYSALHHHWHIDDSVDDTLRHTLLVNDLDHFHYFLPRPVVRGSGQSAPRCAAERAPTRINRTTNFSSTTCGTH